MVGGVGIIGQPGPGLWGAVAGAGLGAGAAAVRRGVGHALLNGGKLPRRNSSVLKSYLLWLILPSWEEKGACMCVYYIQYSVDEALR